MENIVKNNVPSFESPADYPSNAEWMIKDNEIFVSGVWLTRNSVTGSIDIKESEYYLTTLTEIGIKNIEEGTYGLETERQVLTKNYNILGGEPFKRFNVLIGKDWMKFQPKDHKGLYHEAIKMGY